MSEDFMLSSEEIAYVDVESGSFGHIGPVQGCGNGTEEGIERIFRSRTEISEPLGICGKIVAVPCIVQYCLHIMVLRHPEPEMKRMINLNSEEQSQ